MIINKIVLNNFGSYAGETVFDTQCKDERNIIIFGGKNGAGKTTLFTAVRLCLYGFKSMGYRSANSFYYKAIGKLINNTAKLNRPAVTSVGLCIQLSNGHELDDFEIQRSWVLSESVSESFSVKKNGDLLEQREIADFEKYLLSIIPPELFNLFFFDGEKIADFFLDDGGNTRIKEAFLTLCGYDVFEIMRKNFKRINASSTYSSPSLDDYLSAKESLEQVDQAYQHSIESLEKCNSDIENVESEILLLDKNYSEKGGLTQEEWDKKLEIIKEEDKKRESWNALIKKWANDMVPFLMVRNQVEAIKAQIKDENESRKLADFREVMDLPEIRELLGDKHNQTLRIAAEHFTGACEIILGLSLEQSANLLSQINGILSFEEYKIKKCKRAIKKSIKITTETRAILESSSISSVQDYMKSRAALFEKKSLLLVRRVDLEREIGVLKDQLSEQEQLFSKAQSKLEAELKMASISDISAKSIFMLDKLQRVLYASQIQKVEEAFCKDISSLMRKAHFIDGMYIDSLFNVHIYRNENVERNRIVELFENQGEELVRKLIGHFAVDRLMESSGSSNMYEMLSYLHGNPAETLCLPIEIDKASLSNGEKQIFIMALYHALIQLSRYKVPFIIDTPFARIDTEHRRNISNYFFSRLEGQVFILSTNEEIDAEHIDIMRDRIAVTYLLENKDNQKTVVTKGRYFEVQYGI